MEDSYSVYIQKCKAPKNPRATNKIVENILIGIRDGLSTGVLCDDLNGNGVLTITDKVWTTYSLQMQIRKMALFEKNSSLAWSFARMLRSGVATVSDLDMLKDRIRLSKSCAAGSR